MINNVKILNTTILSDNWYVLRKITYEYTKKDGSVQTQTREAYDRGNGATILLYNKEQGTVILTKQFRLPTFINGNKDGMLIEACAGLLDKDNPEDCIRRETEEETGYKVKDVRKVFEAYMSPGSVTEILYFFIAAYSKEMKVADFAFELKAYFILITTFPFARPVSRYAIASLVCSNGNILSKTGFITSESISEVIWLN